MAIRVRVQLLMNINKFSNSAVKSTFNAYPNITKNKLLFLRELIFQIAGENNEIGEIEETLKWENPSYLTHKPKSGTTIRLSGLQADDKQIAVSVHCQTSLISQFKEVYPALEYDGNRSLILDIANKWPLEAIKHFIYLALTYHYRKKHGIGI